MSECDSFDFGCFDAMKKKKKDYKKEKKRRRRKENLVNSAPDSAFIKRRIFFS